MSCPDAFWLDGCAWGSGYYAGLLQGILERWGTQAYEKRWGGSSAGSLFALAMVLGKSVEELGNLYREFARQGSAYGVMGKMSIYHDQVMRRWLFISETEPIDISVLNGRLFIGITQFPCEFRLKSTFVDVFDVMDTLHASMHIPWYCSHINPVLPPQFSNEDQCAQDNSKITQLHVTGEEVARAPRQWYVDGGIARNCDIKLCCPGVTLNVSPVLQGRLTPWDCVFPMSLDRFAEIQESSRLDVLNFSEQDEELFDFSPSGRALGEGAQEGKNDGLKAALSKTPSMASLSMSRSGSRADLQGEPHQDGRLSMSSSYNRLAELASAAASKLSKLRPTSTHSKVLATTPRQRQAITLAHSRTFGLGRLGMALALWGNRCLEELCMKHAEKLLGSSLLLFILRRLLRRARLKVLAAP